MKYVVYFCAVIFALMYLWVRWKHSCSWFDQSQYEPFPDDGSLNIIVWYSALTDGEDWSSLVVGLCQFGISRCRDITGAFHYC